MEQRLTKYLTAVLQQPTQSSSVLQATVWTTLLHSVRTQPAALLLATNHTVSTESVLPPAAEQQVRSSRIGRHTFALDAMLQMNMLIIWVHIVTTSATIRLLQIRLIPVQRTLGTTSFPSTQQLWRCWAAAPTMQTTTTSARSAPSWFTQYYQPPQRRIWQIAFHKAPHTSMRSAPQETSPLSPVWFQLQDPHYIYYLSAEKRHSWFQDV